MPPERKPPGNVQIDIGPVTLQGDLRIPDQAQGIVVFAHGSGSNRHCARNRYVARVLYRAGLGTLLFDLLTAEEQEQDAETRHLRFDIGLLARRLDAARRWVAAREETKSFEIGFFGAGSGGVAALVAAAQPGNHIGAVVSRGGSPDLAGDYLHHVRAPTLLIVGQRDEAVLHLNKLAKEQMPCSTELVVVQGASKFFEEEDALETVAKLASLWFLRHL